MTRFRALRQKYYALKCIGKKQVLQQKQEKSMIIEREINSQCYHPCIMHFITTFQEIRMKSEVLGPPWPSKVVYGRQKEPFRHSRVT